MRQSSVSQECLGKPILCFDEARARPIEARNITRSNRFERPSRQNIQLNSIIFPPLGTRQTCILHIIPILKFTRWRPSLNRILHWSHFIINFVDVDDFELLPFTLLKGSCLGVGTGLEISEAVAEGGTFSVEGLWDCWRRSWGGL